MHLPSIFKHNKDSTEPAAKDKEHKETHHHQREHPDLPKGFANDAMRTSSKPDTLYGFDDPTARRLGPVPSEDPTNTGA
ncbi:hypothetical protein HPULCUR_009216 [Helicostylum pulchrum]|uniref:Uncharacterized protein n=1 Tax=Helicostylum pulchrum TaxID=562976 RepID=A0ABP9Y9U1_9FUNG